MTRIIPVRVAGLAAATLVVIGVLAMSAARAGAASEVIYNNIPAPLPGNLVSVGNEAYSMSEIGGEVEFAGANRKNPVVTVAMSSWACFSGHWYSNNCSSSSLNKFEWPVTFAIYEVGPENTVGAKIAGGSRIYKMPYRPSKSSKCTGENAGKWYGMGKCWNGKAFKISLGLKVAKLPSKAIVSVSYNTTNHGPNPVGETACNTSNAGCFYDSLNVALTQPSEGGATVGADPTEAVFVNSTYPEMFCEGGTQGLFGPATCAAFWEGDQPSITVKALP